MKLLEDRILKDGHIGADNVLKVDSFLNHQIDVNFVCELGKEFYRLFKDENITKILTIEASGIGIACLAAQYFGVPAVFAPAFSISIRSAVKALPFARKSSMISTLSSLLKNSLETTMS
jgi:xanthine phosphoribosyltransferase